MSGMEFCEVQRKFHSQREKEDWLWSKRSYDFIIEDILLEEKLNSKQK
ncbi:MAG: hypothetical protein QXQ02_08720 [Halobacteria archaeon]